MHQFFKSLLIAIAIFVFLRVIWTIFVSTFFETWRDIENDPQKLDAEAFKQNLQGKTEAELWEMRNEYHGYLTEAIDTPYYRFYLDAIGEIDKIIFSLKHEKKGLSK